MDKTKGLFQKIGEVSLGVVGIYIGYSMGSEIVEYAKSLGENKDLLSYVVNQYPNMTKLVTTFSVGSFMSQIGKVGGLVDLVFGTYGRDY